MKFEVKQTIVAADGDALLLAVEEYVRDVKDYAWSHYKEVTDATTTVTTNSKDDCCSCVVEIVAEVIE